MIWWVFIKPFVLCSAQQNHLHSFHVYLVSQLRPKAQSCHSLHVDPTPNRLTIQRADLKSDLTPKPCLSVSFPEGQDQGRVFQLPGHFPLTECVPSGPPQYLKDGNRPGSVPTKKSFSSEELPEKAWLASLMSTAV